MKTKFLIVSLITAICWALPAQAQDQIHKKNDEVISCKVKEIGLDEIKYSLPEFDPDVFFSIDKDVVKKVVFANGKEMDIKTEITNPENYVNNHKNAVKVDFMSPLTGNTTFYYERSLKPGRSIEAGLGIIGLGINVGDRNAAGFFTKIGYKFIKSPDFYLRGMKYAHILKGAYFKPELLIGYYAYDQDVYYDSYYYSYPSSERTNVAMAALFLNFGKQWVVDNSFLVDFFFGVGYGFDSGDYDEGYHFGYVGGAEEFPIAAEAGLKIGWLFK